MKQRVPRIFVVTVVMSLIFLAVTLVIFYIKGVALEISKKYQSNLDCSEISELYTKEDLARLSSDDWHQYY
jgi:hypothetical protein